MDVDVIKAKQIPFKYVSPPVCDYIFSASSSTDIFLNSRTRGGFITGFTISFVDGVYKLRWDTFPGALCYSLYKLVDELDPFSGYVLVAECITDNFIDLTDPGSYAPVPVTPEGEGDIPTPTPTPPGPTPPGCESPDPTGTGKEEFVCPKGVTAIDVSGNNTGTGLSITAASVNKGTVSFAGMVLTFDGPDAGFSGSATINYTVTDVCGKTLANAVLLHPIVTPTVTDPLQQDVCAGVETIFDVRDYIDNLTAEEIAAQTITVTAANIFDVGGALIFGSGPTISYTPNVNGIGQGTITYTAQNQCGDEFSGEIPVNIFCGSCFADGSGQEIAWVTGTTAGTFDWSATGSGYGFLSAENGGIQLIGTNNAVPDKDCMLHIVGNVVNALFFVSLDGSIQYTTGVTTTSFDEYILLPFTGATNLTFQISAGGGGVRTGYCQFTIEEAP